jgi:hypothetical protein
MSSLGERLDAIHLRVRVPGTEIEAELRDRRDVTISFGPDSYDWLSERDLEQYMASLARLLYTAWVRAYKDALSDSFLEAAASPDQRERDFLAARAEVRASGASSDGRVTISAVDMHEITVGIPRGTLRALTEVQFAAATREAVVALLADHMSKVNELKVKFLT